jgi:transposase
MGQHYGVAIVPARPGKPRDKAKVEGGVLIAQRWLLACLRNRRFFSLEELNAALWELQERLNHKPFQKLEGCRRSAFDSIERPAMKPLPATRYEIGQWKLGVGVNIDYHVEYDRRYYSVPSELIGEKVDLRVTEHVVEVWRGGVRVTSHERSDGPKGTAVTKPEHRPRSHREFGDWPPERLVAWAQKTGPSTASVVEAILSRGPHPESGRRSCLGLLRMGDRYGPERLEAACERALQIGNPARKSVDAILKSGLDKVPLPKEVEAPRIAHENIRGGEYFDCGETTASEDEIEARYLAEERLAITMDSVAPPVSGSSSGAPRETVSRVSALGLTMDRGREAKEDAITAIAIQTLPDVLNRLMTLWARPRTSNDAVPRTNRRRDESLEEPPRGPGCISSMDCIPFDNTPEHNGKGHDVEDERRDAEGNVMSCYGGGCRSTPRLS